MNLLYNNLKIKRPKLLYSKIVSLSQITDKTMEYRGFESIIK